MSPRRWTVQHWKGPVKVAVTEPEGDHSYRVIADFWQSQVTEEEALYHATVFALAPELREAAARFLELADGADRHARSTAALVLQKVLAHLAEAEARTEE